MYSKHCHTTKMRLLAKMVNGIQMLITFTKRSNLDFSQGYGCNSDNTKWKPGEMVFSEKKLRLESMQNS